MNKIAFYPTHIEVTCDDDDTRQKLTAFYPMHINRKRTIYKMSLRKTLEVLKILRNIDETNIDTAPPAVQEYFFKELNSRENIADLIKYGPRHPCRISDRLTLGTHQELGREIAWERDRFAFFFDTRTGKTPLSLTIIYDDLVRFGRQNKWLVVCPLILIENAWLEDSAKFYPELTVINCHAATKEKRLKRMAQPAHIYVTNTESFVIYRKYFEQIGITCCIVDESSDMKSTKSKVSEELVEFAQKMKRFYLLSGTPAPNGEHEYYMQMRAIDKYSWQSSPTQFKEHFFVNLSHDSQYEKLYLRPDMKEELYAKIKETAIFVDKADVLNLPGRDFKRVEYEMPTELMKHYRSMKSELYIELNLHNETLGTLKIKAVSVAAKLNKLNQVSSGFIMDTAAVKENYLYGTDKPEWYLLDRWRFNALKDLLNTPDNAGQQVLIWANYRREFELIVETLGAANCRCVHGGINLDDKNEAIKLFKSGKIQYLIANPASADKGLTLTNCHICVYFSLNWSYELFKQSYDRIYADKAIQPHFCNYYIMIAKNTIDAILYDEVLAGKSTASYSILNHLKPEALTGEGT